MDFADAEIRPEASDQILQTVISAHGTERDLENAIHADGHGLACASSDEHHPTVVTVASPRD